MSKLDNISAAALSSNPRATLASWLRYESIVLSAHRRHPQPFIYHPTSLSSASVASKLRDAVRGMIAFAYPSSLSVDEVRRWWSEVIVTHDHEKVYIGPKEKATAKIDGTVHGDWAFAFDTLTWEEQLAFELLLSNGRLKGPVLINHPPVILSTTSFSNVERLPRPDGKLVLL